METNTSVPLKNKVAVVTGASRGIGFAIAEKLCALGASVVLCARNEQELAERSESLRSQGWDAVAQRLDVTDAKSWAALAEMVQAKHVRADILVNNAGVGSFGQPLHETTEEDWERMVNTNLRGVYLGIKTFAPLMIANGGDIVNISSIASKNSVKNGAAYAATKWGVNGLSVSAAEELREYNIRVAIVCPGSTDTELISRMNSGEGKRETARMLHPEDVAHAVATLVTQAPQSFISEVVIRPTRKP